jgi:integrase
MTTFKRGRYYSYEFQYKKLTYKGATGQRTKDLADKVEQKIKDDVRAEAHDVSTLTREKTPSYTAWAELAFSKWPRKTRRKDLIANNLNVALEFWGRRPKTPRPQPAVPRVGPEPERPYHDLRLLDPITDPAWIERFEEWMTRRVFGASRKNQLRSALSMLHRIAMRPAFRKTTRMTMNPFDGVERDIVPSRLRVLTLDEIDRWMQQAPYHLLIAMSIAVLAPKLREGNILALRFDRHIDPALTRITVGEHKADRTGRPLVTPIVGDLRAILEFARTHNTTAHVIEWHNGPVKSVRSAVRASVRAAGMVYGIKDPDGVTFHTLRHTIATLLATIPGLSERMRAEITGQTIPTVQRYTHLGAQHQEALHAELATRTNIGRLIIGGAFGGRANPQARPAEGAPVILRRVPRKRPAAK